MKIENKQDLDMVINSLIDLVDDVFDGSQELVSIDTILRDVRVRLDRELV